MAPRPSVAERIHRFVLRIEPHINRLVSEIEDPRLSLWAPAEQFGTLDPQVHRFLDELKLPAAIGAPHTPNLLFHDLGLLESKALSYSLKSIFVPTSHMLLVNVSGSGKTRIVLEGLLRNWGLYFVCQDDGTLIGSKDLPDALGDIPKQPGFTRDLRSINITSGSEDLATALDTNRLIARSRFCEVLLARLVIFNQFLQSMEQDMEQKNHRETSRYIKKWLYLQLYPRALHPDFGDVFVSLARSFSGTTLESLQREIIRAHDSIHRKLVRHAKQSHFYIVIDEAQEATSIQGKTSLPYAFMSSKGITYRPVLREVVFQWTSMLNTDIETLHMSFVITGTGVSVKLLTEAVASASYKLRIHKFLESSATGAFDSREEQENYVRKYVPLEVLNTDLGRKLLDRMWHWLRGRYRLTASFLTCLIENCYYKPHTLLDRFIEKTAEFKPLDYDPLSVSETIFPLSSPVDHIMSAPAPDFEKLEDGKKSVFRSIVLKTVYEYTMKSIVSHLPGTDGASLLQFGFARVPSYESNIQMDERLVLLSCLKWANPNMEEECPSLYSHVADYLQLHNPTDPQNGFEHYLSYYFAMAFGEFTPLCHIFDFLKDNYPLRNRRAKLVALKSYFRPSTKTVYYEEGITRISSDSDNHTRGHILGCASSLGRAHNRKDPQGDFERWLRFEYTEPFYFPDNSAAADIMFVLKLEGTRAARESYIWVAVQSKLHQGRPAIPDTPHNIKGYTDRNLLYLEHSTLSEAIDTTTPRRFSLFLDDANDDSDQPIASLSDINKQNETARRKRKRDRILDAMKGLPNRAGREFAGEFSCLRVVASWPAITDLKRFAQRKRDWQDPDFGDGHPLACLNRDVLVDLTKDLSPTNILTLYEKKKRSRLLGEVHEIRLASGLRDREEAPGSQDDVPQSQPPEPGPEVDYAVQLDDETTFESQHLYVNRTSSVSSSLAGTVSRMGMQSHNPGSAGPQLSGAVAMDIGSRNATTALSQPGSSPEIQPQPVITQSRGPVVRGKTKVRASQPAKTKPKEKRRTTYKYEKEKDVSETRRGKQPATASTLMPAPRKSARLASKTEAKGKAKGGPQGSDDMDVD
ncbi:hypothetical protein Moror_10550 [Moniliophthora roreri MCA 2997]|uniref:Uncharacterized protein n=1 Tax=Moniliophthora roreri (strain MCA 2997) TaxID=1381753 RepID=V2YJF1_MONRO|nr:hypothetical protein Moror_10550 [Moniliophthora roreri MCA 2997]